MVATARGDRLVSSLFLGAIFTTLSTPVVCGLNPIGGFIHDLGPPGALVILVLALAWTAVFYGILTLWSRRMIGKRR
jgi:hypothetical protein